MDVSHLTSFPPGALRWLLRRAPESLILPPCINYRSFVWLLSRSPTLRKLKIQGASWSAVAAINTQQELIHCKNQDTITCHIVIIVTDLMNIKAPTLRSLDLSWSTINDSSVEEMTSSPTGHIRPGIKILHSRLFKLQDLCISGADITDISLVHLARLPELKSLSLQGTQILEKFRLPVIINYFF